MMHFTPALRAAILSLATISLSGWALMEPVHAAAAAVFVTPARALQAALFAYIERCCAGRE